MCRRIFFLPLKIATKNYKLSNVQVRFSGATKLSYS